MQMIDGAKWICPNFPFLEIQACGQTFMTSPPYRGLNHIHDIKIPNTALKLFLIILMRGLSSIPNSPRVGKVASTSYRVFSIKSVKPYHFISLSMTQRGMLEIILASSEENDYWSRFKSHSYFPANSNISTMTSSPRSAMDDRILWVMGLGNQGSFHILIFYPLPTCHMRHFSNNPLPTNRLF